MMMSDPKKLAVTIISAKKPSSYDSLRNANETFDPKKGVKAAGEGEDDDELAGLKAAMEDFSNALEAKDFEGMAKAFKDADDICESYESDDDDEEGEGDQSKPY